MVAYCIGLKLVTLGQRSKSRWNNIHFFLHNSLITSLLCISALLCPVIMKFGMSLRYTLGWFVVKFHKNRLGDDVIVLRHCYLDLWPKVTNFNNVWASAVSNHLAKTAFQIGSFVRLEFCSYAEPDTHTHTHTDTHTHTQRQTAVKI